MSNLGKVRNFVAEAAVPAFTILKPSASTDLNVLPAAGPTDALCFVSTDIPAAIGERCDGIVTGIADVMYGGVVTRGDQITSDASGRAVTAVPAAGVNNRIIGVALVSGVLGDIGQIVIVHGSVQG